MSDHVDRVSVFQPSHSGELRGNANSRIPIYPSRPVLRNNSSLCKSSDEDADADSKRVLKKRN
jgi:hypothetical protein